MPIPIQSRVIYDSMQALNFSGCKELLKSPAHYQAYLNNPREETKALKVGKYVHALVLEPDAAVTGFAILPEGIDRRTKDGKATYEAFMSTAEGKTVLTLEEATPAERTARSMTLIKNRLNVTVEFTELMFTTAPRPAFTISGTKKWQPCTTPMTLTRRTQSQSSRVVSRRPPERPTPALFTRMSSAPKRRWTSSANARIACS